MQASDESPHTGYRDTWRKGIEKSKASLGALTRTLRLGRVPEIKNVIFAPQLDEGEAPEGETIESALQ